MDDKDYLDWLNDSKLKDWPVEDQKNYREGYDKTTYKIFDEQASIGYMYIRHLIFMNGGALVAMLGATAALMANNVKNIGWTWDSMFWFFLGLIVGAILNGSVYLRYFLSGKKFHSITNRFLDNQITYGRRQQDFASADRLDKWWMRADILLGVFGLIFFILGFISGICQLELDSTIAVKNLICRWYCTW